jgi:hypothetical protein
MTYYAGYAGVQAPSTRERMAYAWIAGHKAKGANMHTDGQTLWSYAHVVGVTLDDGTKVAFDCHYSVTTTKQTGPAKVAADLVAHGCPSCRANYNAQATIGATDNHTPPQWTLSDVQLLRQQNV